MLYGMKNKANINQKQWHLAAKPLHTAMAEKQELNNV
jgi:hypothetical protein